MISRIAFVTLLWCSIFSNTVCMTADSTEPEIKSENRFNLSCGIGGAMGLAGIAASYDFCKYWGVEAMIGFTKFPGQLSLKYNYCVRSYPIVLSPRISLYNLHEDGLNGRFSQVGFTPGVGLGVDVRTYINRFWFVNNCLGLQCTFYDDSHSFFTHTGTSLGFTLGGENPHHVWEKYGGLAILNSITGLMCSILLPFEILASSFSFSMPIFD